MVNDMDWVTIRQAVQLVNRSQSTIKRLVKKHGISVDKRKTNGVMTNYINKRELLMLMAGDGSRPRSMTTPMTQPNKSTVDPSESRYINHLESMIGKQDSEIRELKGKIDRLLEENRRLNEEIKGLLRQGQRSRRGIVGYLVERIIS